MVFSVKNSWYFILLLAFVMNFTFDFNVWMLFSRFWLNAVLWDLDNWYFTGHGRMLLFHVIWPGLICWIWLKRYCTGNVRSVWVLFGCWIRHCVLLQICGMLFEMLLNKQYNLSMWTCVVIFFSTTRWFNGVTRINLHSIWWVL